MAHFLFTPQLLFIGSTELLLIGGIALLLFGGKKLPEMMRGLGQGVREFKKESMTLKRPMEHLLKKAKRKSQKKIHQKMN